MIRALLLLEKVAAGEKKEKTDDYSGHYGIASSRPLERCTLVPKLVENTTRGVGRGSVTGYSPLKKTLEIA